MPELPVRAVLPALGAALKRSRRVVLVAPPGSGKTTLVAPWLLDSGLVPRGEIVVLQPRRVAARSVARFMAEMRGERVGETVGFQVRFEQEVSARTRIRVVTEGILTARLQASPDLAGVAAVVLDEFHERSIHADLALALLKEVQEVLRDDLLVIVMSATLDAAPIAAFLGDCEIVRAEGRSFEVATTFADEALAIGPGTHPRDVEARMARGVLELIDSSGAGGIGGDVLGFLPGVRLIEGTRQRLMAPLAQRGFDVEVLHGSLGPREQDLVLTSGERPRVVLATNIAETSLTIPGVRAVVDSGLAKVMRYDLAVGSGRLETGRISKASADQRRGRAGRLGPGRCLRLWTRFEDDRLVPFEAPEIRRVDLTRMVIELASWGADPLAFGYFEAPDERALEDARRRLVLMGALDERLRLTALGKAIAELPSDPRIAAFLVAVARRAPRALDEAASWAAVLDGGEAAGDLGEEVRRAGRLPHIERAARQLATRARQAGAGMGPGREGAGPRELRELMLAGYVDRVGARREGAKYALVGGRLGELDRPIAGAVSAFGCRCRRIAFGCRCRCRRRLHRRVGARSGASGRGRDQSHPVVFADRSRVARSASALSRGRRARVGCGRAAGRRVSHDVLRGPGTRAQVGAQPGPRALGGDPRGAGRGGSRRGLWRARRGGGQSAHAARDVGASAPRARPADGA